MRFMQRPTSRCTENVASFESSKGPTKWPWSMHRTQVDLKLLNTSWFLLWCWFEQSFEWCCCSNSLILLFLQLPYKNCDMSISSRLQTQRETIEKSVLSRFFYFLLSVGRLVNYEFCLWTHHKHVVFLFFSCAGLVDIEEGELTGQQLKLQSQSVARISFAKEPHVQQVKVVLWPVVVHKNLNQLISELPSLNIFR